MTAPNTTENHRQFRELPNEQLYALYWGLQHSLEEIGKRYGVPQGFVRRVFRERGIPFPQQGSRDTYLFAQRSKRYHYELYWGEDDYSLREIASQHNVSQTFVITVFTKENIPRKAEGNKNNWFDKERGIPKMYKQPRDEQSQQEGSLPDDPDTEKYLAETPLHRDKERLYELHWEYGCSAAHINAMGESDLHIREWMEKMGVPVRPYFSHKDWEPHHGEVPPMFEWSRDSEQYREENGIEEDEQMNWGRTTPAIGD